MKPLGSLGLSLLGGVCGAVVVVDVVVVVAVVVAVRVVVEEAVVGGRWWSLG